MLLGLGVSMAVLEVGLRLFPPAWLEQRMGELNAGAAQGDELGTDREWPIILEQRAFRQFVPHSSFRVRHYEYDHAVTIDELGGRTTPYPDGHTAVVPIMGDSFTFGVGVEDAENFVSLLATEAMRSAPEGDSPLPLGQARILNLGMTGTALHNHLDTLELRHEELGSPERYVFCLFMGNDLTNILRHYRRSALDVSSPGVGGRRRLWQANVFIYHHPLLKKLFAIQFLRQKLLALINRGDRGFMDPVFLLMRGDLSYLEDSLGFLRQELARLTDISNRLGFEAAFILIPDVHQLDAARLAGKAKSLGLDPESLAPERIAPAISGALDDFPFPYLDIGPCLSKARIDGLYYTQDNHFTAAGHALAARCILDSGRFHLSPATDRSVVFPADNVP